MPDRLKFSIRSLLFFTALIASLLAAYRWQPSLLSLSARSALMLFTASLAIVGCCSTEGVARAFWIGVAIPLALSIQSTGLVANHVAYMAENYRGSSDKNLGMALATLRAAMPFFWVAPINGLLCALAYRLLWTRQPGVDGTGRDS